MKLITFKVKKTLPKIRIKLPPNKVEKTIKEYTRKEKHIKKYN